MITIPHYITGRTASITFAMILVSTAIRRGMDINALPLSAATKDDARQLDRIASWLIEQYPNEFERAKEEEQ